MDFIVLFIAIFIIAFCLPLLMQIFIGAMEIASWIVILIVGCLGYILENAVDFLRRIKCIR